MASLSKLFGLWREVVDEAVESERYGALHWMASGLARALRRWQAAVKAGGDGRRVLGKRFFLESHDITVGQVWRRWRTNALSQAVPRMLSRFVFQWTQRLGTSSFDRWRGLCHEVRQWRDREVALVYNCMHKLKRRKMVSCILLLQRHSDAMLRQASILRRALINFTLRKMGEAWRTWAELRVIRGLTREEKLIRRALLALTMRKLGQVWRSWVIYYEHMQRQRRLLLRGIMSFRSGQLHLGWNTWVHYMESLQHQRSLLLRGAMGFQHHGLLRAWNSWQHHYGTVHRQRTLLRRGAMAFWQRHVCRAWRKWRALQDRPHGGRAMLKAIKCFRHRHFVTAWNSWVHHAQVCKRQKALLRQGAMAFQHRRWREAWNKWRRVTLGPDIMGALRKAVAAFRERELVKAWNRWEYYWEESTRQRALMARASAAFREQSLLRGWNTWIATMDCLEGGLKLLRKAAFAFRERECYKAWNRWKHFLEDLVRQRQLVLQGAMAFQARGLRKGWRSWTYFAETCRFDPSVRKAVVAFRSKHLLAAWNAWDLFMEVMDRQCYLVNKGLQSLRHRHLRQAWNSWHAYMDARTRQLSLLNKGVQSFRHRRLRHAWNSWVAYVDEVKRQKLLLQKAIFGCREREIFKAWNSWQLFIDLRCRQKLLLHRGIIAFTKRTLMQAFRRWRSRTEPDPTLAHERAIAAMMHRRVARGYRKWRHEYECALYLLEVRRKAILHFLLGVMGRAWNQWCFFYESVLAEKDAFQRKQARALELEERFMLLGALTRWNAIVHDFNRRVRLLRRSLRCWRKREMGRAWRTFQVHMRHVERKQDKGVQEFLRQRVAHLETQINQERMMRKQDGKEAEQALDEVLCRLREMEALYHADRDRLIARDSQKKAEIARLLALCKSHNISTGVGIHAEPTPPTVSHGLATGLALAAHRSRDDIIR